MNKSFSAGKMVFGLFGLIRRVVRHFVIVVVVVVFFFLFPLASSLLYQDSFFEAFQLRLKNNTEVEILTTWRIGSLQRSHPEIKCSRRLVLYCMHVIRRSRLSFPDNSQNTSWTSFGITWSPSTKLTNTRSRDVILDDYVLLMVQCLQNSYPIQLQFPITRCLLLVAKCVLKTCSFWLCCCGKILWTSQMMLAIFVVRRTYTLSNIKDSGLLD